uniref:hypothetical protein n=1 Tax=Selenomonas ruminantium TaxID=971 RepID=UPI0026F0CEE0
PPYGGLQEFFLYLTVENPYSDEPGHGTGMISLRAFVRKYNAQCDLRQQDGWVTVMLYWHGEK